MQCHACPVRQSDCGGPCACRVDGRDITAHAGAGYCPHPSAPRFGDGAKPGDWPEPVQVPASASGAAAPVAVRIVSSADLMKASGPKLWHEIHKRPLEWAGGNDGAWLNGLAVRLPCGDCRRDYLAFLASRLPESFASGREYFAWTVDLHNHVARKLGKRPWGLDEAGRAWGF